MGLRREAHPPIPIVIPDLSRLTTSWVVIRLSAMCSSRSSL